MSFRRSLRGLLVAALCFSPAVRVRAQEEKPAEAPKPKLTKPPKLTKFVDAPYPESEKKAGKQATVTLKIAIGADGKVTEVAIEKSGGAAFDAAAIEAAKQFVFEPAEIDGKPAPIRILYEYAFVLKETKKTTADFAGVVRDRKSKKPLAGVTIALDDGKSAVTDAEGKFSIVDVVPGKHAINVSGGDVTATQTEETFEAGKRLDVVYAVSVKEKVAPEDQDDMEIVVTAPPIQKTAVSTEVAADQGRKVPGTSGDVVKVVESMPGVARATAGSGALVVWGASPQDTRVYVDGVRIPVLYHLGGVRSVLAGDLVKSVELVPGGYGAAYGRGLGGIVLVQSKPLDDEGFHGSAAVDVLDASATARAKIKDGIRFAIAARRSHLDAIVGAATDRDVGELFPIPKYWDGQLRLSLDPSARERIEISGLASSDRVDRIVGSADPARARLDRRSLDFTRVWIRWRKDLADGSSFVVIPSIGFDKASTLATFGSVPTELAIDSSVYALRTSWRGKATDALTVTVGADAEVVSSSIRRSGSIALPAREGDLRVFGQPPPDRVNADAWRSVAISLAPFVEGDLSLFEGKLHLLPGLRLDPYVTSVSRRTPIEGDTPSVGLYTQDLAVEPRMTLRYAPNARIALHASWGRYRQQPQAEDLSAVFGTPTLGAARATHYVLGAAFQLGAGVSTEVTAFHATSDDLAVRNPLASPVLAEALVQSGQGRVIGTQFLLRKTLSKGFFGWVSWTVLRSERRNREEDAWRISDFDQSHVLTALASYDLGRGFELGARFRYATGLPRTPVVGATYDARRDLWEPVFGAGAINASRLPAFVQFDVRLARRTKLAEGTELETYLDVQNVTNRSNAEEVVYDSSFTKKGFIKGIPILPVLGARLTW